MLAAVTTEATRRRAAALNARLHPPGRVPCSTAQGFPIPGRYRAPLVAANTAAYRGYRRRTMSIQMAGQDEAIQRAGRSPTKGAARRAPRPPLAWNGARSLRRSTAQVPRRSARRLEREYRESGSAMLWA